LSQKPKTLCIYHDGCADGVAAAWVVQRALGKDNIEFHPAAYGTRPPDVSGRKVVIVDFSYPKDILLEMEREASWILVLDHHKTAALALDDFHDATQMFQVARAGDHKFLSALVDAPNIPNIGVLFDMNHSGAMLAWMFFFGGQAPQLICHVEDRDLWKFNIPRTREVMAAVFSYPLTVEHFDLLVRHPISSLITEGEALLRKQRADVALLASQYVRTVNICGFEVPCVNAPHFYASDIGDYINKREHVPFVAVCWITGNRINFSLRSREQGEDVSKIAEQFGGGGHKKAAGFLAPVALNSPAPFSFSPEVYVPDNREKLSKGID
jgi:hypothetical protein